jgi:fructose-1,6-bisphosphatase I
MNEKMKIIINEIKKASIDIKYLIENDELDKAQSTNNSGDVQVKLDIKSDLIIQNYFTKLKCLKKIVSEEQEDEILIDDKQDLLIAYDPLDGSSLIDVDLSVGSIYGVFKDSFEGKNLIAGIYVVFGPRVELVVAYDGKVQLYRLMENEFKYIEDIKLNANGSLNSPGSLQKKWPKYHKDLMNSFFDDSYKLRYSGGMVPDLHQILLKGGGIFSYPASIDNEKGKLRALFEVFPFAFVYECAGGEGVDNKGNRLLERKISHIHDTIPCYFGSRDEIKKAKKVLDKN